MTLDLKRRPGSADADTEPDAATTDEQKLRRCLACGTRFQSAWAGERVCKRCRSRSRWRQG